MSQTSGVSDSRRDVPLTDESLAELAQRYSLHPATVRPRLADYVRALWGRRHFLVAFANARLASMYTQSRLGQLWQLLTPLLNAAVYLLLFGILLRTSHGVENFVGFLLIGVFVFTFTQRSVIHGADALNKNLGLIRALHFPRATLPLAYTFAELQQLGAALIVLAVLVLLTGEAITSAWLLVPVAVTLQALFNAGLVLTVSRLAAQVRDLTQVLPFMTRAWLYMSGVFYSISHVAERVAVPEPVRVLLEINPAAVYIDLVRQSLLGEHVGLPHAWPLAVAWALVSLVGGFLFFWQAEERYGRG